MQDTKNPQALDPEYEDVIVLDTVSIAPNFEPVLEHAAERREANAKLESYLGGRKRRPNIILFMMDDVGWGDLGCYGGGHAVGAPTPNMDRLAREGLLLTSCYSQPSCSPTRATTLTGRLPVRHGLLHPPMYGEQGGLAGEATLAKHLQDAGYVTQAVGKWHCGENDESLPHKVGFEDFYGFLSVSDMYTEWRDPYFYPEIARSPARTQWVEQFKFDRHWVHAKQGGEINDLAEITIEVCEKLDDAWADYSERFIRRMASSDKPFFLQHATRGAHFDNYPRPELRGTSPAKYPYKDVMMELDAILGRLVKALKDTGQLEDTIIFITSDNGPEMEAWPDSGHTPFRCAKGSTWEGGVRVPGIFYWNGMIDPGRVSDGLFDMCDLFPTFLGFAGVDPTQVVAQDTYIDGIDQTSMLLAEHGHSNRRHVYYWLQAAFSAIRCGEYKWVLTGTSTDATDAVNPGGFTGTQQTYSYPKIFNLYMDPKETHSTFVRRVVYNSTFIDAFGAHMKTLKSYPPKVVPIVPFVGGVKLRGEES